MTSLYKYDNNSSDMKNYINNVCHELRTPLQIICGTSENALGCNNLINENPQYYKDMTIINRNCEILLDKVESCIQEMKNLCKCNQSINNSEVYEKSEERCRGCYLLNKWIIDKNGTNNQLLCSKII